MATTASGKVQGWTRRPAVFGRLAEIANGGGIEPLVAATNPLQEIAAAQERFGRGDFVGKLALLP